jgi:3-hydroxyacyl-[acyl-carrier-protein] dehydratase
MIENLYTVVYKDDSKVTIQLGDENHPVFKAHFPTNPLLPGFMNFEIISKLFDIKITSIKKAKFLRTVAPNQIITYQRDANKFKVTSQDDTIANFVL